MQLLELVLYLLTIRRTKMANFTFFYYSNLSDRVHFFVCIYEIYQFGKSAMQSMAIYNKRFLTIK